MLTRRPGIVTFAAIMMFIAGGFELVVAISEFAHAAWLTTSVYGNFGGYLWLWGIVDLIVAGALFYAGYDILRGGQFGFLMGVVVAAVSAIRWFFYIPAEPFLAVVVIAVDILIIFGLTSNSEYFQQSSRAL
jgi:hypothetical protein